MTRSVPLTVVSLTMNEPERLHATALSVGSQQGVEIEHLIINGGSALDLCLDATPSIRRTEVMSGPTGIYPAMNLGLDRAEGQAIMFLHSGDRFFGPHSASYAVNLLSKSRWGFGDMLSISGAQARRRTSRGYSRSLHALGLTYIPHPSTIMSTELLRELGGFDPDMGVAADQWTLMRAAALERPAKTRYLVAIHLEDGASAQRDAREIFADFKRMRSALGNPILGATGLDDAIARAGSLVRDLRRKAGTRARTSKG